MKKNFLMGSTILLLTTVLAGDKKLVDCRFVNGAMVECMPYPSKLFLTKEVQFDKRGEKLIFAKTLPLHKKPQTTRTFKVDDMIEEHLEIYDPIRYTQGEIDTSGMFAKEEAEISKEQIEILQEFAELKRQKKKLLETKEELLGDRGIEDINKTGVAKKQEYAKYRVRSGDFLNLIAKRFGVESKEILALNKDLKHPEILQKGAVLMLPLSLAEFDLIVEKNKKASLKERQSAFTRRLEKKYLSFGNGGERRTLNEYDTKLLDASVGTHSLRVQATAYTSHGAQTDSTPGIAAWGHRLEPGMKVIAVSRDLIGKYGLRCGSKVKIQGLQGVYTVLDKMNPKFVKRIDIYMGLDRRKALRWGRRRTVLSW